MLVKLCVAFAFMLTLAAVDLARAQQRCYIQCDADYAASRQSGQRQGPQGKRGPVGHSGSKGDKVALGNELMKFLPHECGYQMVLLAM